MVLFDSIYNPIKLHAHGFDGFLFTLLFAITLVIPPQRNCMLMDFDGFLFTLLFAITFVVELPICMGVPGCVYSILWRVARIDIASWPY